MAFLDSTAVQVALPSIGRELDSTLSGLQWTITGYTLALASLILLGGSLGDRYGRRRVFLVGVGWFAVASLVCGVAQHTGQPGADPVLVPAGRPGAGDRPVVGAGRHLGADRTVPRRSSRRCGELAA